MRRSVGIRPDQTGVLSVSSKVVWVDKERIASPREYRTLISASRQPAACQRRAAPFWWDVYRRDWPGQCYRQFDEAPDGAKLTLQYPTDMIQKTLITQENPGVDTLVFGVGVGTFLAGMSIMAYTVCAGVAALTRRQPHHTQAPQ
ncbi:unnamed protein product [Vitrella brassicaformis CCMP3155]|uniref:Uncharacterized protein n=1 Tax=Vitrella brassicaformis (strain CCMP3155) TaxID=1169540 RepID=A0A0G4H464_VITBC|nr:unnamed protein product [Vitrella brassicaformis CCMP3155]|mmetsp:Transcript_27799/g.69415  ORF Transcript_27799/g.69415 Transcript_27799/m.69415 type:complete len:145 (-) Transcript_27799:100-534(-)|eukprot:CEM38542.1 unnamed protein product [Vitrella brassicaformis CCMP3155]